MTNLNRTETAQWLAEQDHFCVLTHRRPDGDTTGSASALCLALRSLGKEAHVLENPELTPKFAPLLQDLTKPQVGEGDTLVAVDVAAPGMLLKGFGLPAEKIALRIDHHGSGTPFAERELVDPQAGAAADIIYDLLMELWVDLDEKMATALYTAVSTDTGCFRFANTTDHSFLVAAACARAKAPVFELNQALFETNTLSRLRLQGWMVENGRFLLDGKAVVCPIPRAVEEELGIQDDDMDNIAGFLRTIAGVCVAATLRENAQGHCKASVRAVPGYDAAAVCAVFGGGGHKGAGGTDIPLPMDQAAAALEAAIVEQVGRA